MQIGYQGSIFIFYQSIIVSFSELTIQHSVHVLAAPANVLKPSYTKVQYRLKLSVHLPRFSIGETAD